MKKLFIILVCFGSLCLDAPAQCNPVGDSLALVALYNAADGPNWTNNANWLVAGQPIGSWARVTVNAQGCVTQLALSLNQLSGAIPSELGDLKALEYLSLSSNELSGFIPLELSNLQALEYLSLQANQLSGTIPPELGSLTNLEFLSLQDNQLEGPVPPELGNLTSLQLLSLQANQLSGSAPPELGNLPVLERLSLSRNQLSGPLPPELGNLPALVQLTLSFNQLSGPIPAELSNLQNLAVLQLDSNQLEGCFPDELMLLCDLPIYSFEGNPALPWSGDFGKFCEGLPQIGAPCDDGDPLTQYGEIQADCSCLGFNGPVLKGAVSVSDDEDCATIDPVAPLSGIIVKAEDGIPRFASTDENGGYQFNLPLGTYTVNPQMPLPFLWDSCSTVVNLPIADDTTYLDFSMPALANCPFITVELALPVLERCFEHEAYIQYCNHGTVAADSVVLFLELDPLLSISSSGQPWVLWDAGSNLSCSPQGLSATAEAWYLPVGSLEIGECAQLAVPILTDCNAEEGQTHCISAYACPDDICTSEPSWSGAEIMAEASCAGDSVVLLLRNFGPVPSQPLEFIVVEDDVVLLQGIETHPAGGLLEFRLPSSGQYFRIQSAQEPGHPFPQPAIAWEAGCNGSALPGADLITQFPMTGGYASQDTDCRDNIGAYDPNDKQGFPLGYGSERLIEQGVGIDYLIRFQNTGTAPARDVVIRDTLAPQLDPASLRIGPGSHPLAWSLEGEGILVFRFEGINLPDSLSDAAGSQGFVSFRIAQQPGLPLGTDIHNRAAIYFDFNPPIITNETRHRIGEDFLPKLSSTTSSSSTLPAIVVMPNPSRDMSFIQAEGAALLRLYAPNGQLLRAERSAGDGRFNLSRAGLPSGVYFVTLFRDDGQLVGRGKVVFW